MFINSLRSLLITAFIIAMLPIVSFAQQLSITDDKYKVWSANDSLQWADFKKFPEEKDLKYGLKIKTLTSLVYFYTPSLWHIDSCMNVYVAVRKQHSFTWDSTNLQLLKHESIHFDIAELFARYLRKELITLSQSDDNTLDQYLYTRDSLFQAAHVFQDKYDEETMYGLNSKAQKRWAEYVRDQLSAWKDYTFDKMPQLCQEYLSKNETN
jgi:hypothetical protein